MSAQAVRTPAYQSLADDIRAQITSGRLRPGDRLPTEPQLCQRSGVSRSTVREALRLLASQHLIVTTRGVTGGSFVAHPSPDKLADTLATGVRLMLSSSAVSARDLFEVREMLEVPAAALGARRRTPEQLAALEAALFDPIHDDVDTMLVTHRAFHLALAGLTGNALYQVMMRPLYSVANQRQLAELAPPGIWFDVDREHREILRAVADGDPAAASAATARHLRHMRELFDDPVPAGLTGSAALAARAKAVSAALPATPKGAPPAKGALPAKGAPSGPLSAPSAAKAVAGPGRTASSPVLTGRRPSRPSITGPSITGALVTGPSVTGPGEGRRHRD